MTPRAGDRHSWVWRIALALCIAAAGLGIHAHFAKYIPIKDGDAPRFLRVAYDLATLGRYTDGSALGAQEVPPAEPPPGMFVAPLYPALLAAVIKIDPRLAATARCISEKDPSAQTCSDDRGLLVPVQFGLGTATVLFAWAIAWLATGSERIGWASLFLLAFGCFEYGQFTRQALTETLSFFFFGGATLCFLLAMRRGSLLAAFLAGALLGLAGLTRPAYNYLGYTAIALVLIAAGAAALSRRWRTRLRAPLAGGAVLALAFMLAVAPWVIRNGVVLGVWDVTRYGGTILAQRVALDAMTPSEYGVAWIYFLPDFGHSWAKSLFSPESYRRLGWTEASDTYYQYAVADLAPETELAAGGSAEHVRYLVSHMVLPDLPKYAAVTLLLAWRGLWFGKYFSVIAFPLFVAALVSPLRRRAGDLLLVSLPALLMLFLHAAVSVNTPRYNVILAPSFAIGAAICFVALYERLRQKM